MSGVLLYGLTTPIRIAGGLGVRTTYNPGSATASFVSGVMDSMSNIRFVNVRVLVLVRYSFDLLAGL